MKTIEEIQIFLPKDKFDNYHIEDLYELTNEEISLIAPNLLVWLKDVNLPVSKELIHVLKLREEVLRKQVLDILTNLKEDSIWKYNIINHLINNYDLDSLNHYKEALIRISTNPTKLELDRETSKLASLVLEKIK